MFKTEREMQDLFVSLLKQRKTCGLIFEEVGNRNFFFRTDVVEYQNRDLIIGYELKLHDFNKLIKQCIETNKFFDKVYMVVPEEKIEKLKKTIADYKTPYLKTKEKIEKFGIIGVAKDKYKIHKGSKGLKMRNYDEIGKKDSVTWYTQMIQDLIIRGYYKSGENKMKSYK